MFFCTVMGQAAADADEAVVLGQFCDFVIVVRATNQDGTVSDLVTEPWLRDHGMTRESLALVPEKRPCWIRPLRDLVSPDLMEGEEADKADEPVIMVGSTVSRPGANYGASILLDAPEQIHDLAVKEGCDLFVIPSSVHEVLFVPENQKLSPEDLAATVRAINPTIAPEVRLSDHVYRYRLADGAFEIAA